jgi:hypothetical protein
MSDTAVNVCNTRATNGHTRSMLNLRMTESLRDRISGAVSNALLPLPHVLAGWEGGSAAFSASDDYSDIDLNYLVDDAISFDVLYAAAEEALSLISPIILNHAAPPGRYFQLQNAGAFLLVDLCFFRLGSRDHCLDVRRHGHPVKLFDKGEWLRERPLSDTAITAAIANRREELHRWFPASQAFVHKAMLRGHDVEAIAAFWAYTLKPLVELLRMRYCPARWDFGLRYLDRDLPPDIYQHVRELMFVRDVADLTIKFADAAAWGQQILDDAQRPNSVLM